VSCCKCCCGGEDCTGGQEGKCCCGGSGGACCQPGEYCCSGVCMPAPCSTGACCFCTPVGAESSPSDSGGIWLETFLCDEDFPRNLDPGSLPFDVWETAEDAIAWYQAYADAYNALWQEWVPVLQDNGWTCVSVETVSAVSSPWEPFFEGCTNPQSITLEQGSGFRGIRMLGYCCGTVYTEDGPLEGPSGTGLASAAGPGMGVVPLVYPCIPDPDVRTCVDGITEAACLDEFQYNPCSGAYSWHGGAQCSSGPCNPLP
jgi:hypothetical protein